MIRRLATCLAALIALAAPPALAQGEVLLRVTVHSIPARSEVLASIERMADWQLAHRADLSYIPALRPDTANPRDW